MAGSTQRSKKRVPPSPPPPEVVDPVWLVKAIAGTLFAAFLCSYITLCVFFYRGQWQLVLHPTRTSASPQSIAGTPYELIHFGPDESAAPQLTGWWIPAAANARYAQATLLFLPGADGSLADSIPTLTALHNLGINVFAFDYRGYGQSAATHPSQMRIHHDAESAWQYLTTSRHIPSAQIIPYGTGIGTSVAALLAASHRSIPAVILDSPQSDLLDVAMRDPRSNFVPVRLLFHERFPLAGPLTTLTTPKLLISYTGSSAPFPVAFRTSAAPKITVTLAPHSENLYAQALIRFLDQYLPAAAVPQLVPTPAPAAQNPR